jgi:transcriptional regulator with XRE-family HTH domain
MTKVRQIRKQLGTTAEVAPILGMTESRLRDIESGRRPARAEEMEKIAQCFGTTIDQLFGHTQFAINESKATTPQAAAEVTPPPGRDMHRQRSYGTDANRAADAVGQVQIQH